MRGFIFILSKSAFSSYLPSHYIRHNPYDRPGTEEYDKSHETPNNMLLAGLTLLFVVCAANELEDAEGEEYECAESKKRDQRVKYLGLDILKKGIESVHC